MKGYLRIPQEYRDIATAKFAILPIPFEQTTSWLKGTKLGPEAIIEASQYLELYDIETDSELYRKGVYTAPPVIAKSSTAMVQESYHAVKDLLQKDKFVVSLGGEHSVTIGPVQAFAEKYSNLSVLHFDAHADMRETYEGSSYSHACVLARINDFVENRIVSVGIRSMDISEKNFLPKEQLFLAETICTAKTTSYIEAIISQLSDHVYVTFDVDAFELGIMPSTGTPEPGGLGWYQALQILKAVCKSKKVVGADFVELMPSSANAAPDFVVAKLIYKFLSYCAALQLC